MTKNNAVKINITMGQSVWKALKIQATREEKSASRIIEEMVYAYLTGLDGEAWEDVKLKLGVSR